MATINSELKRVDSEINANLGDDERKSVAIVMIIASVAIMALLFVALYFFPSPA